MRTQCKKAAAALSLLAAVVLSGCGYKNLPVPPEEVVPQAVTDLRFIDDGPEGRLEWTYPVESVTGENLAAIDSFELFQTSVAAREYCPTCPIPFGAPQVLAAGETSIQGKKRSASVRVPHLAPGNRYFFKVRSRTSWWVSSEDSNVVTFVWQVAAAAPQGLSAKATSKNIALSWQPQRALADGSPLTSPARYQVQRSEDGKSFTGLAVVDGPRYVDNAVRLGREYFYRVQAVTRVDGEETLGGVSAVVKAALVNAPVLVPPTGVGVAVTAAGARVYWDQVEGARGYRIYRRSAEAGDYQRIGQVVAEAAIFVDKSAREGVTYYYAVTTLGADDDESAQSRPAASRW
ncbi:MAG: hypothetical protein LBU39_07965 [Desulfobulbaceae bacterium]|jgi:hypothetical protein|nr:hypothetical protein [Desulfobulbaceae bacterium]